MVYITIKNSIFANEYNQGIFYTAIWKTAYYTKT